MKHLKYLLLILFIIPLSVHADNIGLTCPTTKIRSGGEFTCTIFGPEYCATFTADLVLPDGFSYKSGLAGDNYTLTKNSNTLAFEGTGLHSRVVGIITLTAPVIDTETKYNISLENIKFKYTSSDTSFTNQDTLKRNITVLKGKNSNTSTTSTSTTTPSTINVYTLKVADGVNDNQNLTCKADNNSTCDVDLSKLTIPTKEGYIFNGWSNEKDCTVGIKDKYTLSKNETIYACFKVSEGDMLYLENIIVNGNAIEDFSKFKTEYTLNYDVIDTYKVEGTSTDKDVKIEVNAPENYVMGTNIVTITLTKNSQKTTYTININIGSHNVISKTLLKELTISDYNLNFKPEVFNYNLKVSHNTKELNVNVQTSDENASYIINGNKDIKDGSKIIITVFDNESNTSEYTILIEKQTIIEEYKNYLIAVAVIIFCLIVYFIVGMKKHKFDKTNKKVKVVKKERKKAKKSKKSENIETLDL